MSVRCRGNPSRKSMVAIVSGVVFCCFVAETTSKAAASVAR